MLFTHSRLRIAQKIDIQVQFLVYFYVILCILYHFSVPLDYLKIFKLLDLWTSVEFLLTVIYLFFYTYESVIQEWLYFTPRRLIIIIILRLRNFTIVLFYLKLFRSIFSLLLFFISLQVHRRAYLPKAILEVVQSGQNNADCRQCFWHLFPSWIFSTKYQPRNGLYTYVT
jgi:hypothetical protein